MKKVILTILIFAAVLAVLVGIAALVERSRPAEEPETAVSETDAKEKVITNEMDELRSTRVSFADGRASVTGAGAQFSGGVLSIGYPGTYRLSGELTDGQVLVDLGDFHGAVYLILDGVSVSCSGGPALYVKQSDLTVLHLTEGAENSFADGADYFVAEGQTQNTGAGIYSADDLVIEGAGTLSVTGNSADGIRSKDALTIRGGTVRVYSADDGIQASDMLAVEDGDISVGAYGDGLCTTKGDIEIAGGAISVLSAGDGVSAEGALSVTGGTISVTAHGGAENYTTAKLADVSAKGLKAATDLTVTNGTIRLDTADDALHAGTISVTGGTLAIATGDDALHADGLLSVAATLDISACYEALEGDEVRVSGGSIRATAKHKGVDAGDGGFVMTDGTAMLAAPRCITSDAGIRTVGGAMTLYTDGTESVLSYAKDGVIGGMLIALCGGNDAEVLLERGAPDGSLLFILPETAPEGTEITLTDEAGNTLAAVAAERDTAAVLIAGGALGTNQTYTLSAGEQTLSAPVGEGCVVEGEPAAPLQQAMGGASGGMMPRRG